MTRPAPPRPVRRQASDPGPSRAREGRVGVAAVGGVVERPAGVWGEPLVDPLVAVRPGVVAPRQAERPAGPRLDVGHIIHPVLCEGQVEGGTLQAVGYATIEEIKLLDGRYLNDRLQTYIIPTSLDAPRIDTILVEAAFEDAPHKAKGVGELPMDVGAPAVVAAIHDATGAWIDDLPATPERILAALAGIESPGAPGVSAVSKAPAA